jgi:hypothetical protein
MNANSIGRRARYRLRNLVSHVPAIYLPLADMKKRDKDGATIVTRNTELVMDAFPRSGSTFAVTAFRLANGKVELAHHFHAPAQLIRGARLGKPVLLIVRQPKDAVCSFALREPHLSLGLGLKSWINFHRKLLPYAADLVVAGFERITTDFGLVIDEINRKFGTSFARFEHTEENVQACFRSIEKRNAARFGGGTVLEEGVARPSKMRQMQKTSMEEKWQSLPPQLRQEAVDLHGEWMAFESRRP